MHTMPLRFTRYAAEKFVDMIVGRIILFTDYFILQKHVSLSEASLFIFCCTWALWLMAADVTLSAGIIGRYTWIFIFSVLAVAHFTAFLIGNVGSRACIAALYAAVWLFLAIITIHARLPAPAAPTLLVLSLMSIFISVRLFREHRCPGQWRGGDSTECTMI